MNRIVVIVALVLLAAGAIYMTTGGDSQPVPDSADAPTAADTGSGAAPAPTVGLIDDARIINAESEPGNWLAYGRTYEEQRFSPLEAINKESVGELGLEWYRDMGSNRALESTPIVVDGTMFLTTAWSRVHAIDAVTGEEKWMYDPKVPGAWARKACCDVVNRGAAVYKLSLIHI